MNRSLIENKYKIYGGTYGVTDIIVDNGHGELSSKPGCG